jgi:hypothetical protein
MSSQQQQQQLPPSPPPIYQQHSVPYQSNVIRPAGLSPPNHGKFFFIAHFTGVFSQRWIYHLYLSMAR